MNVIVTVSVSIILTLGSAATNTEFSDFENMIRVFGSLNPNTSTPLYINGSVFMKQPGKDLRKILNYEGYNINRKIKQADGSWLSLSREFLVYRNPATSQILQVWMNPVTNQPNEVFPVANDPVNGYFHRVPPHALVPETQQIFYMSDYILEYPNPLTPDQYLKYSAGPFYDAVEVGAYYANYTTLKTTNLDSIPTTGGWTRKSQFMPWMEMSTMPGSLYFTALVYKCNEGLSCVADDIMQIINEYYQKFKYAPTTDEQPNETSWTLFKKTIDQRRLAGLPDIIIPTVNISTNARTMVNEVDTRVANVLYNWPLYVRVNGTAYSEIVGKQSVTLFDIRGNIGVDFEPLPEGNGYRLQLDGGVQYVNHTSGKIFNHEYNNPITGQVNNVSYNHPVEVDLLFQKDSLFTIDIPTSKAIGLIGAQSVEGNNGGKQGQDGSWAVTFVNLIFPYSELAKPVTSSKFFGSFSVFQNWPAWMEMGDTPGNIVFHYTLSN